MSKGISSGGTQKVINEETKNAEEYGHEKILI